MDTSTQEPKPLVLLVTQVYVPDPAAVGQVMADVAAEIVNRGYRARVLTSNRGYEDPARRFPPREEIDGVDVRRLPFSSLGKRSLLTRVLGGLSFTIQCIIHGLFLRKPYILLVSTVPPMALIVALVLGWIRRVPVKFWVMDLNPDQVIALGMVREKSWTARSFDWLNRRVLSRSSDVIVLDKFMAERVHRKLDVKDKTSVIPPWAHENHIEPIAHEDNPFRAQHVAPESFVVMYSGNIGYCTPIDTLLAAAKKLRQERDILFFIIGGGVGHEAVKAAVQQADTSNIRILPYQPLTQIKYSLSAADVHVVTLSDVATGIVHPCKIYGAMAAARPVLFFGPERSYISDLFNNQPIGRHVRNGDISGAVDAIRELRDTPPDERQRLGETARQVMRTRFSKRALCGAICDVLLKNKGPSHS